MRRLLIRVLMPLAWLDGFLQGRFVSIFQWLMQRGITKRTIRRNLWAAFVVTRLLHLGTFLATTTQLWLQVVNVGGLLIVWWSFGSAMKFDDAMDEAAERTGKLLTMADMPVRATVHKMLGAMYLAPCAVILVVAVLDTVPRIEQLRSALDVVSGLAILAQGYLSGVWPSPPKPAQQAMLAVPKVA